MSSRAARVAEERLKLLEVEASLQRVALAATFAKLEQRRALAWGGAVATWGLRILKNPQARWLIATGLLSRLRRKRAR